MRLAVLLFALFAAPAARGDVGLNVYGLSWHTDADRARELGLDEGFNPGLGLRYRVPGETVDWFVDAGAYRDSARSTAVLAGAAAHWKATEQARLGLALVVYNSDTYNRGRTFIAPLPVAAWDFGPLAVNMVWMPKVSQVNDINTFGFWLTYYLR